MIVIQNLAKRVMTRNSRWPPCLYMVKTIHTISWGWSGDAMVLGKLPVPGRPTIWITVGQGPTALAVGAGGGCLDIFTLIYPFFPLSPSLWGTARYSLKYCLKGPLNPKPTNIKRLLLQKHWAYIADILQEPYGALPYIKQLKSFRLDNGQTLIAWGIFEK